MLFPTVAFAVFFVAAFTVNWVLRPNYPLWRATMIAFSLYFCGWVDLRFALVAIGSAALNTVLAAAAHRAKRRGDPTVESRRFVRIAVVADLAVLGVFAYHGFLVESVSDALHSIGLSPTDPVLDMLVPVGLSVFTLHAISYVVDVGRGDIEPVAFGDLLLYLTFFPHLVVGPVVRVDELVPQFHERPDPRRVAATDAFVLIGVGLVKAVVVAGYLGTELVDPAFATPGSVGGLALLVGAYALAIQIYAGLSGATDVAVGCALLLGVDYPQNFDAPYQSLSVREFWERWNMTLSRWLRDYLYIPLGGSRHGLPATCRNLMITMMLGGLWYGVGWTFVVWGGLHGAYLVVQRAASSWYDEWRGADTDTPPGRVGTVLRWASTFSLVSLAWVFFRADSVGDALEILGRIATGASGSTDLVTGLVALTIVAALASQLVSDHRTLGLRARFSSLRPVAQVAVLAAGLTIIGVLGPRAAAPIGHLPF
jgi:D-alanyl-lipoteichoic acid acyltransferase DltB (MBOAT superfamily)